MQEHKTVVFFQSHFNAEKPKNHVNLPLTEFPPKLHQYYVLPLRLSCKYGCSKPTQCRQSLTYILHFATSPLHSLLIHWKLLPYVLPRLQRFHVPPFVRLIYSPSNRKRFHWLCAKGGAHAYVAVRVLTYTHCRHMYLHRFICCSLTDFKRFIYLTFR